MLFYSISMANLTNICASLTCFYIFGFYHNLYYTLCITYMAYCQLNNKIMGLCKLLSVCMHVTNIPNARFYNISQPVPHRAFGAQYFSPVPLPITEEVNYIEYSQPADLYYIMKETGSCFNYIFPRIPVKSELHIDRWKFHLKDYHNPLLVQFLEFGFPLGLFSTSHLQSEPYNHASANNFPDDVAHYLQTEIQHKAIWGPYDNPPIPLHLSPFLSRPKPNSDHRHMIIDLSWPKGHSVNSATCTNIHVNAACALSYN